MAKDGDDASVKPAAEESPKLESKDAHQVRNASGEVIKATEATRTNTSDGSLRDRTKPIAERDDSIQIMGMNGRAASRTNRLSESELLRQDERDPATRSIDIRELLGKPEKEAQALVEEFGRVTNMPLGADRDAAFSKVQQLADKTYGRGQFANLDRVGDSGPIAEKIQIGGRFFDKNQIVASNIVQPDVVSDATGAVEVETDKERITPKSVEKSSPTLIKSGLGYNAENVPVSQKFAAFVNSAQARLFDPAGRKAYFQGVIDETLGIGEGLDIAKEEVKESAKMAASKALNALADGSVANFMATPNAINEPLFKTIGSCLDTMSRDPNAVNNVLIVMGRTLEDASDRYGKMSPHDRGVQDGKAMFYFINPSGSTEAGEVALKAADRLATHVDKTVVDGITKAMQAAENLAQTTPELAAQSRQMVREYMQNLGLSPKELQFAGVPSRYVEELRPASDNIFMMKEKSHDFVKNLDGLDRVDELRLEHGVKHKRNIAYAEIDIAGHDRDMVAVSGDKAPAGTVDLPEKRLFTPKPQGCEARDNHSELKILEHIAKTATDSTEGSIKRLCCKNCLNFQIANGFLVISLDSC